MTKTFTPLIFSFFLIVHTLGFLEAADHVSRGGSRNANAAGYSTRDATVLSMMGWGLGLAAGIALLCILIETSSSTAH